MAEPKSNAKKVSEKDPSLKSRGLKNPAPSAYPLGGGSKSDMSEGNDGSKKASAK